MSDFSHHPLFRFLFEFEVRYEYRIILFGHSAMRFARSNSFVF